MLLERKGFPQKRDGQSSSPVLFKSCEDDTALENPAAAQESCKGTLITALWTSAKNEK